MKGMNTFLYISFWLHLPKGTNFVAMHCHYKSANDYKSINAKDFNAKNFMDLD